MHESARIGTENRVLTPKQEAAAVALASGCTIEVAAREAGAGVRTIKTWLANLPAFSQRVQDLRGEMTGRALGALIANMSSAAETLGYLCRKAKSEMARLSAARAVLELSTKLRETTELAARIEALERGNE